MPACGNTPMVVAGLLDTAYAAPTAYFDPDAEVFGNARVYAKCFPLRHFSGHLAMLLYAVKR